MPSTEQKQTKEDSLSQFRIPYFTNKVAADGDITTLPGNNEWILGDPINLGGAIFTVKIEKLAGADDGITKLAFWVYTSYGESLLEERQFDQGDNAVIVAQVTDIRILGQSFAVTLTQLPTDYRVSMDVVKIARRIYL